MFKPTKEKEDLDSDSGMTAIVDLDYVRYAVASVGEEVVIKAIYKHKEGVEKEFKNKTEFLGRSKKTIGGWLGERNKEREGKGLEPFKVEDFEIEQVQRIKVQYDEDGNELSADQAKASIMHSAKQMVLSDLKASGASDYICVLGKGASFREGLSTLMKYKGNRDDVLRPLMMDEVTEYLKYKFDPIIVEGIEADDKVVMLAQGDPDRFILGVDKDYRGQPVKYFDANRPDDGIMDGDCFGELTYNDKKKKVLGVGRIFLYWQMLAGDSSDNYKANCCSDVKLGDKGAYDVLVNCKDDQEALEAMIAKFKELYSEPKEIETWRGNKITVDWYHVANEQFQMARMLRWEGDFLCFDDWCKEYGVSF